jgi:hypothetical protein
LEARAHDKGREQQLQRERQDRERTHRSLAGVEVEIRVKQMDEFGWRVRGRMVSQRQVVVVEWRKRRACGTGPAPRKQCSSRSAQ